MARQFVVKAGFQRAYDRLERAERELVKKALGFLQRYFQTGQASAWLGLKKLAPGIFEIRAGLSLRMIYVEEGPLVVLALLGSHDEVRRFLHKGG